MKRTLFRQLAFRKGENWHYFSGKNTPLRQWATDNDKNCTISQEKDPTPPILSVGGEGWDVHLVLEVRAFLALRQFLGLAEGVNS